MSITQKAIIQGKQLVFSFLFYNTNCNDLGGSNSFLSSFRSANKSLLEFFAVDLTMTVTGTSVEGVSEDFSIHANRTIGWCGRNGMVVHTGKTKARLVSTIQRQPTLNHGKFYLQIGDTSVPLSDKERLLGITVDNSLKWSAQVEAILNKCNSLLYLLGRIKIYLDLYSRKLFFNAYILPQLDYCSTIWGNCSTTLTVIKFQKRAARVILDKDINTPSNELFKQLGWMRFYERVNFRKALMMYKVLHNLAHT